MMSLDRVILDGYYLDSAEQVAVILQYADSYQWLRDLTNPEEAADAVMGRLVYDSMLFHGGSIAPRAYSRMRQALVHSAHRFMGSRDE